MVATGADLVRGTRKAFEDTEADWDVEVLAVDPSPRVSVTRVHWFGSDDGDAGPWESFRIAVSERDVSWSTYRRAATFDETQFDEAFDLFEEWMRSR